MENNQAETYLRLAKPRPEGLMGILSLVFSRFAVIVLILLAQIALYVAIVLVLKDYIPHLMLVNAIIVFFAMLWLFNKTMDSTAKMTWMFIIAVLPLFGVLLLLFTQTNFGQRKLREQVDRRVGESQKAILQPAGALAKIKNDPFGTDDLVKWLNLSGCFPIFDRTEVTYFPLGELKFEAMLEELRKAEKYIYMEYFIIEEGYMWGSILEILIEKAKAGVDVRVMYDGMCEISNLPWNYSKLMEEHGIKAHSHAPLVPLLSSHYNYRDHRKILVIDGKVAFNGGVNLGDEYINREERFGHWKDTALMIKGPAVKSFTLMFLQMWMLKDQKEEFSQEKFDRLFEEEAPDAGASSTAAAGAGETATEPAGLVVPFCDEPLDEYKAGETVYMDILNRASSYVHIMTPYLILDGELETALKYAAQRGVEVKLILPGIPDKKTAYALAKSHYRTLVKAGVKIYEYTPGFVHAKVFVSDDCRAVVGTINLDYRSLYHHFECGTFLYRTDCISDIEADFQDTLAKCRRVTRETIKNEAFSYKIMGFALKIIAPLM